MTCFCNLYVILPLHRSTVKLLVLHVLYKLVNNNNINNVILTGNNFIILCNVVYLKLCLFVWGFCKGHLKANFLLLLLSLNKLNHNSANLTAGHEFQFERVRRTLGTSYSV